MDGEYMIRSNASERVKLNEYSPEKQLQTNVLERVDP